jgi:hypothetical protein
MTTFLILAVIVAILLAAFADKRNREVFLCDFLGLHWWGKWNVDNNRWCVNCETRQRRIS